MTGPPALPAIPNTPAVYRFLPDGALDTSYSTDGIGTGTPLGPAPAFSEAYDVAVQEGGRYVLTGYGNTATTGSTVDMVAYRFKANGDLDPSFGTGGVTRYDAGIGQEDRGRDINVTSEGRVVIAGSSAQGAGDLIGGRLPAAPQRAVRDDVRRRRRDEGRHGRDRRRVLRPQRHRERHPRDGGRLQGRGRRHGRRRGGRAAQPRPRRTRVRPERRAATGPQGLPGAGTGTGAGNTTPPPPPPPAAALVSRKAKIGTMKFAGSTVSVPLTCAAGSRCKGTVRLRSVAPVRVGRSMKVISATRTVAFNMTAGTKTVRLALSQAGRTVLKRAKRLSVKVVVDPATGALVTKRATLRR